MGSLFFQVISLSFFIHRFKQSARVCSFQYSAQCAAWRRGEHARPLGILENDAPRNCLAPRNVFMSLNRSETFSLRYACCSSETACSASENTTCFLSQRDRMYTEICFLQAQNTFLLRSIILISQNIRKWHPKNQKHQPPSTSRCISNLIPTVNRQPWLPPGSWWTSI